jgi:hypothetical protein
VTKRRYKIKENYRSTEYMKNVRRDLRLKNVKNEENEK